MGTRKPSPHALTAALGLAALMAVQAAEPPTDGKNIFRFDTFGDEQLWTDTLQANSVELEPGRSYVLASIGPLPRADGSGPSAPRLVLVPAE